MDTTNRPAGTTRTGSTIDPARPALEYLTLDRPRFHVEAAWDLDGDGWWIDEPGLYVTCRICGIPVATLVYTHNICEKTPQMVWGLDGPRGDQLGGYAIGDISESGEGVWTWDEVIAEIRDRLGNTSLAAAVTGYWYDLLPSDDKLGGELNEQREDAQPNR